MTVVHVAADQVLAVPGPCKIDLYGTKAAPVAGAMPVPTVGSISPTGAVHGAGATSLTLTGTNYYPSTRILWGGSPVDTVYISPTQVRTTLTPEQLATAGTIVVKAQNGSVPSAAGQNFVIT